MKLLQLFEINLKYFTLLLFNMVRIFPIIRKNVFITIVTPTKDEPITHQRIINFFIPSKADVTGMIDEPTTISMITQWQHPKSHQTKWTKFRTDRSWMESRPTLWRIVKVAFCLFELHKGANFTPKISTEYYL